MEKVKERFISKVVKTDNCWIFNGGVSSTGYGVFWMNGKSVNSHVASYSLLVGLIPNGAWILHNCDNKLCVNPSHLYLGDRAQNTKDAVDRNRMAKGINHGTKTKPTNRSFENNPFGKLSKDNCIAIKNAIENGISASWIASQVNVHVSTVYKAKYKADALLAELDKIQ